MTEIPTPFLNKKARVIDNVVEYSMKYTLHMLSLIY